MRKTSLTAAQAQQLGKLIHERRRGMRLTVRELANAAGLNVATIFMLEHGDILSPQPHTLKAIALPLNLSMTDIFTLVGWLPPHELPALKPYLRAKYHTLDSHAIAALEAYAEQLAHRHGGSGPIDHEDEQL